MEIITVTDIRCIVREELEMQRRLYLSTELTKKEDSPVENVEVVKKQKPKAKVKDPSSLKKLKELINMKLNDASIKKREIKAIMVSAGGESLSTLTEEQIEEVYTKIEGFEG